MTTSQFEHLIVVPCHGVYRGGDPRDDGAWSSGVAEEAHLRLEHARRGAQLAANDPRALLVFSGGQTSAAAGSRSEAESYKDACAAAGWFGLPQESLLPRVLLEEYARDLPENLLYALAAFRLAAGHWPARLTVLGWGFKAERCRLHAEALGWGPETAFDYVTVNDPPGKSRVAALAGEHLKLVEARRDPFLQGARWRQQRAARDPFRRGAPYRDLLPELAAFLDHVEHRRAAVPPPWLLEEAAAAVGEDAPSRPPAARVRTRRAPKPARPRAQVVAVRAALLHFPSGIFGGADLYVPVDGGTVLFSSMRRSEAYVLWVMGDARSQDQGVLVAARRGMRSYEQLASAVAELLRERGLMAAVYGGAAASTYRRRAQRRLFRDAHAAGISHEPMLAETAELYGARLLGDLYVVEGPLAAQWWRVLGFAQAPKILGAPC